MNFTCEEVARTVLGPPLKQERVEALWRCPHPDRHKSGDSHPSLKVNIRKDTWGCFVCGVGGTAWQLAGFIAGIDTSDKKSLAEWLKERGLLNTAKRKTKADDRGPCIAEYVYRDARGDPVARKLRYEPGANGRKKDFGWQRFNSATRKG